ncbi:MAG: hypothetical protein KDE28_06670 [Anaerolineales bacterium]|nr:hypothetical protein [Anaerolineales bacterium]
MAKALTFSGQDRVALAIHRNERAITAKNAHFLTDHIILAQFLPELLANRWIVGE